MATSLADDGRFEDLIETRAVSRGRRLDRAEGLWTLFGAALLVTFLSYVVVSGA
jgi:hypothetical protein